jgi:hypothetical protein
MGRWATLVALLALAAPGCFRAVQIPASKDVHAGFGVDTSGAPLTLTGCVDLPGG